jgi:predicted nucleic acid-binding protein
MILVDTSVWVDHFNLFDAKVDDLLNSKRIFMHPFVIGELAMGNLQNRDVMIAKLNELIVLIPVRHTLIMAFIKSANLYGSGLQYVDAHLLGSVVTTAECTLWTKDKRLLAAANRLGVAF